jgi:hypothetical protein
MDFTDSVYYMFLGAGCNNASLGDFDSIRGDIVDAITIDRVHVECNRNASDTYSYIVQQCFWFGAKDNKFARQYVDTIINVMENKRYVILMGHSYGGAIVSNIVEMIQQKEPELCKQGWLIARTFGSIYVPKYEKTSFVNLKHYIYQNDISWMCLSSSIIINHSQVVVLDTPWKFTWWQKFDTSVRWKIHNFYTTIFPIVNFNLKNGGDELKPLPLSSPRHNLTYEASEPIVQNLKKWYPTITSVYAVTSRYHSNRLFVRVVDSTKNIIAFGALKNGNPDGLWMDLDNLGTYVNGRAHGFWSMKEGSIEAHGSFINGYREGLWIIKNTTTGKNEMVNYHKGKKFN